MRISRFQSRVLLILMGGLITLSFFPPEPGAGEGVPTINGISMNLGYTYDPRDNIIITQISVFRLYDYDAVWPHNAPENLRFKIEAGLGVSRLEDGDTRLNGSINIFALHYLSRLENNLIKPYVEAGIGCIYTDYRVHGQDYRFNFNPQAGVGFDIKSRDTLPLFAAVRLHHLSNGGIGSSNRGQNSVICLLGCHF
ncbi:MAG: acyloxyacyl hydrolase [Desulfobacterium sp.]|nr:acyloxyacyl hydrolase [Desulfobacterium sp.]